MTVKELIEELRTLPQENLVILSYDHNGIQHRGIESINCGRSDSFGSGYYHRRLDDDVDGKNYSGTPTAFICSE